MSAAFDASLAKRAASGDEAAFAQLIEAHGAKLRRIVASYAHASDTSVEDLAQILALKVWTKIERGHYNPHRAPFDHFASVCAGQALRDDKQRRRAQRRWTTGGRSTSTSWRATTGRTIVSPGRRPARGMRWTRRSSCYSVSGCGSRGRSCPRRTSARSTVGLPLMAATGRPGWTNAQITAAYAARKAAHRALDELT